MPDSAESHRSTEPEASEQSTGVADSLIAENLGKRYGRHWVLRSANLRLRPGQVLALLGENGAGKSTLVKILSGAVRPDSGTIQIAGQRLVAGSPERARRAGIAIVYQELSVCPDLSIEDNVMLGQEKTLGPGLLDRRRQGECVREILERLGHGDLDVSKPVRTLSIGQQQLVEIARALLGKARVLVLDEPTSSLAADDVKRLFSTVRVLAGQGMSVIYISHFLEEIREICDSYLVLRDGEVAGTGELGDTCETEIVELMVGRKVDELFPQVEHTPQGLLLDVQQLSGRVDPRSVSFQVRRGEIFGLAGLIGAGRTETLRLIAGLDRPRSGYCTINQKRLTGHSRDSMTHGIAMVSEDRKLEGLAQTLSIQDNLTLSRLKPYSRWGWLNDTRRRRATEDRLRQLDIKTRDPAQSVASLSGGNQQKVALARVLHQEAICLLLDEPTRGVDVATKAQIYRLMGELAAEGHAILFVSSYFRELLALCDTIGVMFRGRMIDIRPAERWTEHRLLIASMSGQVDEDVDDT